MQTLSNYKLLLWNATGRIAICLFSLCAGLLFEAVGFAGSMSAEVDKTASNLEEPFELSITITGSLSGDVLPPETPDFDFTQAGHSTNISIINGAITKELSLTYIVRPTKEGDLTIPSFKATVDKEVLQTLPLQVKVKGGAVPPNSQRQGGSAKGEPSNNGDQKLVFVERELPKNSIYVGEVLLSKVRLLHRVRLSGATPARDHSPEWRIISSDQQRNSEVVRDNMRWNTIEMTEGLIPLKHGKIKVPGFGINATWVQPAAKKRQPRSLFDMFQGGGFNMGEEVSRKLVSSAQEMVVKPLPTPRPASFADLVGAFTITSDVSKRDLNVGDTATVTIQVKGQGSLDRMRDLKLDVLGSKVYADKPSLEEKLELGVGLASKKIFKFAVVPHAKGSIELGVIRMSSFNPFTEAYETLDVNLGALNVAGDGGNASPNTAAQAAPNDGNKSAQGDTSSRDQNSEASQTTKDASDPALNPPSNTKGSLEPKELSEQTAKVLKPWYLAPLALAVEFLLFVLVLGYFVVTKIWKKYEQEKVDSVIETKIDYNTLLNSLDQVNEQSINHAIQILKSLLVSEGQSTTAMTSNDLIHNAQKRNFSEEAVQQLKSLTVLLDERAYGDSSPDASLMRLEKLNQVVKDLLAYCRDHVV